MSDIHVGWLAFAGMDEILARSVRKAGADLVVVTGDLVQRAHRWQYRKAASLLQSFKTPLFTIPGNHDLYSWIYRPWARVTVPLGRYRKYFGEELSPEWQGPGVALLGLNTTTPWTIQRGRCTGNHIDRIEKFFRFQPPEAMKILVFHHPIVDLGIGGDVAIGGEDVLASAVRAGVDLLLCGHWHVSAVRVLNVAGKRIVVAQAGTASSGRYRPPQVNENSYNVVTLRGSEMIIEVWAYSAEQKTFVQIKEEVFNR